MKLRKFKQLKDLPYSPVGTIWQAGFSRQCYNTSNGLTTNEDIIDNENVLYRNEENDYADITQSIFNFESLPNIKEWFEEIN